MFVLHRQRQRCRCTTTKQHPNRRPPKTDEVYGLPSGLEELTPRARGEIPGPEPSDAGYLGTTGMKATGGKWYVFPWDAIGEDESEEHPQKESTSLLSQQSAESIRWHSAALGAKPAW